MSKENEKTLEVYKKSAYMYLDNSAVHDKMDPNKALKKKEKLENLIVNNIGVYPKGSKIFEIGSGDGSNAKFIKDLGYEVTASDVAKDFINATKEKGLNTINFNVLQDNFSEKYSAVFCWRVFVHFTKEDAEIVLKKVYDSLENGGIFIFNAINRELKDVDDEWVDFQGEYHMGVERYYKYYSENELNEIINSIGYNIKSFNKEGGEDNNKWLVYVLKK